MELEESPRVDEGGTFPSYWRVALPLAAPSVVATSVRCLVCAGNDCAFATTITGADQQTIPVAASQGITQEGVI